MKKIKEETIEHIVTEQEITDNNLSEVLEAGDTIEIPIVTFKAPINTMRQCTCGEYIDISILQEGEVIVCECGVKHSL
jgi:hypothetical protein